ncbi:unnamed protein product, partial [Allacma fusca]
LPQNVTGPCSRVLCLDGYTCILPRRRIIRKHHFVVRTSTCKLASALTKPVNGTRRV